MKRGFQFLLSFFLFFGFLASSYFAVEAFATYKIKEKIDKRLSKLPYEVSYSELRYKLLTNDLVIRNFSLKGTLVRFSSDRIAIDLPASFRKKAFPPELFFSLSGGSFHVDLSLLSEIYPKDFEFNVAGGYGFSGDELSVNLISSVKGIGEFSLDLELSSLSYRVLERVFEGRTTLRSVVNHGRLKYLRLKFKNEGAFERFLSYAANQEGVSVERVRKELLNTVRGSFKNRLVYEKVGKPLEEFIRTPDCIEVVVRPKTPVGLKTLKEILVETPNVEEILQSFGVELKSCS